MTGNGGRFQQIHGVNEQQDFSNGLNTITATDVAFSPLSLIRGERFSPSQVWVGGNSRKSKETKICSIPTPLGREHIKMMQAPPAITGSDAGNRQDLYRNKMGLEFRTQVVKKK
jgi:hypothetical protein